MVHLQKRFEYKYTNDKNYCEVKDHCHFQTNTEVPHVAYFIQNIVYLKKSL